MNSDLLVLNSEKGGIRGKSKALTAQDEATAPDTEDHQNYQKEALPQRNP